MAKRESLPINELVTPTGQRITFGTAAPTTQYHKVGDTVINVAPAADGVFAWSCTVAGTPGTWVTTVSGQSTTGMPTIPTATVAAAGTKTQGSAAAITAYGFCLVSGADATVSVKLPAAAAGKQVIIKNGANAVLPIFPNTDDGINALTVNTGSLDIAALTSVLLVAYDATTWYTLPLLPS